MEEQLIALVKLIYRAVKAIGAFLQMVAGATVDAIHLYGAERWGTGGYGLGFADGVCMTVALIGMAFCVIRTGLFVVFFFSPTRIVDYSPFSFVMRLLGQLIVNGFSLWFFWQMVVKLWELTAF
jgi:hypothetical protein